MANWYCTVLFKKRDRAAKEEETGGLLSKKGFYLPKITKLDKGNLNQLKFWTHKKEVKVTELKC